MREKLWIGPVVASLAMALLGGCGGKVEDGSSSGAKTYGALDVANGTCAPVVGRTLACGSAPTLDGLCASGTKPFAHVLQQDLAGGATGMQHSCVDASGAAVDNSALTGPDCRSVGDWYASAYAECAMNGLALGSFKTMGSCSMASTTCSIVVTCCPG